ncbi:WD repeat-containing protein 49-like, partial [Ruditapes philippinarum]|uniref:WD repeat-containing protein 49-like n=1 Tax=Ruditapes philippinarum TaxID=129788 RepID=UPI00295BE2DD
CELCDLHLVWQETCLNVDLHHIAIGKYKNVTYTKFQAHIKEWARQVKYSHYLECFISCATSSTRSVMIGWMEKHTSVNQPTKQSATSKKEIQRTSAFTISQGVNAFDFSDQLNLIATAGVNHHVCLWNPYVVSKPNGILRGHMASVVQVQFIKSRGQLISFSKDKVLRIWDVQLQVCIQRLAGMFPKGPEVYSSLFFDEGKDRHGVERNRLFISFNYQLTLMEMKAEIRDRIMSHEKPVVAAIYNSVYNQVVSVCQAGTMVMWMIDTGQKVKQFNSCHGSAEVTCLTQDSTETRLLTSSTDGTVKIWDFNGHCYHTLDCSGGQPADIGQVLSLKRSVVAVGWAKYVTVFRDTSFREFHVLPSDWKGGQEHAEDVLCAAFQPPNILATGSYDGEIVIWNTNSEHSSRHLTQRMKKRTKSRSSTFVTKTRENTNVSAKSRQASRASLHSRGSGKDEDIMESDEKEENEYSWAISKLLFLEARKGNSASGCANLVSCGGNGIVRFGNFPKKPLRADFTAPFQKALRTQFQPHQDMINTLELCERNERLIIISASSDCSVSLWDVHGNRIGTFGQEEHWKIEPYNQVEELEEEVEREEEEEDIEMEVESDHESEWTPNPMATENPSEYRVDTWESTHLGKEYQESRRNKRQRQQPGTIPDLAYLHWERTGAPPSGPYSVSYLPLFFLKNSLRTAYDEKSLFPAYIREFEAKMKNFHTQALSNTQPKHSQPKTRPSLQNIGLQLGAQMSSKSPKPQNVRQKGLSGLRLKPLGGIQSRRSSVTTES